MVLVQSDYNHSYSGQNLEERIAKQDEKIAEQAAKMAEIVKNVKIIQSVVMAHHPELEALLLSGNTAMPGRIWRTIKTPIIQPQALQQYKTPINNMIFGSHQHWF